METVIVPVDADVFIEEEPPPPHPTTAAVMIHRAKTQKKESAWRPTRKMGEPFMSIAPYTGTA